MRRSLVGLCVLAAVLTGCDSKDDKEGAEPEGTTTTTAAAAATTSSVTAPASAALCSKFPESSPSRFDAKGGQYAVYLTKLDVGKRIVGFDVVQFLGGEEAAKAYKKDNPGETEGPPNDYYIVNENKALREAPVSETVGIQVFDDDPAVRKTVTLEQLPAHLGQSGPSEPSPELSVYPFWLTVADGTVNEICQQYVP